jgi:prepilin-type N-terminal cleavage/methylation domain-containing protein
MKHLLCKERLSCAFTLIELLVVIAIIAILAALLLPSLSTAKTRAVAMTDINNCRQTILGMIMFSDENNDVMPSPGWKVTTECWIAAAKPPAMSPVGRTSVNFQKFYDQQISWFTGITAPEPGSPTPPGTGQLYPYLKNPKIFLCPQDKVDAKYLLRNQLISSYVWNGAVVGYADGRPPCKRSQFKPTNILQWENDESNVYANSGIWADFSNYPLEWDVSHKTVPSFSHRHGRSSQVGRMDGSAGRVPYADMVAWATETAVRNDLWCNPATDNGH